MGRVVYFNLEKFYNQTNQNGKIAKNAEMVKSVKIPKLRILLKMRVENL